MHALKALNDGLLELIDYFGALAAARVDLVDALVVDLNFKVGGPAAVAAQPGICFNGRFHERPFYAARLAT